MGNNVRLFGFRERVLFVATIVMGGTLFTPAYPRVTVAEGATPTMVEGAQDVDVPLCGSQTEVSTSMLLAQVGKQVMQEEAGENFLSNKLSGETVSGEEEKKESKADIERETLEQELGAMVQGYPIQDMVPLIAQEDRTVAAFLVGLAKKESDWGKHSPSKDGENCYNYWGYTAPGTRGKVLGYSCFGSPEEAVAAVGGRLQKFVFEDHRTTPGKMLVWKCGGSCASHDSVAVKKWVSDVEKYFYKIVNA